MSFQNHKYVSIGAVSQMLSRNHKQLEFEKADIIEWCWEAVEKIGNYDSFTEVLGETIPVRQGRALLPCGVYRLLRIRNNGGRVDKYHDDGTYIHVNFRTGELEIDYLGVPIIDDYPAIDVESRQYCYWYCYMKLRFEDYLQGNITEHAWSRLEDKANEELIEARGSFRNKSHDDLDRIMEVLYTFVKTPAMDRRAHYYGRADNQQLSGGLGS